MEVITVIIIVISVIASIWEKIAEKKRPRPDVDEADGQQGPPVMRPVGRESPTAGDWQRELRKLLQPEESPQQPVPPIIRRPGTLPPRAPAASTRPAQGPAIPTQLEGQASATARNRLQEAVERAQTELPSIQKSIEKRLTQRKSSPPVSRTRSAAVHMHPLAQDIVRDGYSLRRAILAGVILGPAKALED